MKRLSRRSLIAGVGTATTAALAGCLGDDEDDEDDTPEDATPGGETPEPGDDGTGSVDEPTESELPPGLREAFGFVYGERATVLRVGQPRESQGFWALRPESIHVSEGSDLEWFVRVSDQETGDGGTVATGSIQVDDSEELTASGKDRGFDLYEVGGESGQGDGRQLLATDGDVLLTGPGEWVERTIDSHADGVTPYFEAHPEVRAFLATVGVRRHTLTLTNDRAVITDEFGGADLEFSTVPEALAVGGVQESETVTLTVATLYPDAVGEREVTEFEDLLASEFEIGEATPEQHADGRVLLAEHTEPYAPPEDQPEVPGYLRYAGYDSDRGEVLFEFRDGEPLPVENFEIEIESDVYDGNWARGQDEIGSGSVIAIDAGAIEPGDRLRVSYEGDGFSSASGTPALRPLPFQVRYEPDDRRATVTYADGPPLDAERVSITVDDTRTVSPWEGELASGDTATVEDADLEAILEVVYERSDGEQTTIGHGRLRPPGRFEFAYDAPARELTISYPEAEGGSDDSLHDPRTKEQRPAQTDRYEIRVDGEPADTQLTDAGETFEPGDAVTLTDVPVGAEVAVFWLGEDERTYEMSATQTAPDVSFAFEYDEGSAVIRHAGGMAVEAGKLSVRVVGPDERTVEWTGTDTVGEGDELVVEDVGERGFLVVQYLDRALADRRLAKLVDGEDSTDTAGDSTGTRTGRAGSTVGTLRR